MEDGEFEAVRLYEKPGTADLRDARALCSTPKDEDRLTSETGISLGDADKKTNYIGRHPDAEDIILVAFERPFAPEGYQPMDIAGNETLLVSLTFLVTNDKDCCSSETAAQAIQGDVGADGQSIAWRYMYVHGPPTHKLDSTFRDAPVLSQAPIQPNTVAAKAGGVIVKLGSFVVGAFIIGFGLMY